ncbi:MAG: aspartate/glutamate racemase family protein [SAR324 cluster bacterium]|nr:aspartate/glutamate racemase family protein [SAR324 cluster bacterium]MBL7035689.1 aspartate/glutamate racemase family protein [SAR324 cluster bacterium]
MDLEQNIIEIQFATDEGLGERAKIGLIVLSSDQTLEYEFRTLLNLEGVAFYHARIPNEMEITKDSLAKMESELSPAAALLPAAFNFKAIGYGCTSGATIIGEENVAKAIQLVHPDTLISNPLTACKAAFQALGLKRIAFLTPYDPAITSAMRDNLLENGFEIPVTGSFFESDDFKVGRISPDSILEAIEKIGTRDDCDGVFVSCTNLRVAEIIETAEERLGKAVTSSNHALAWHLLRLAGINDCPENCGSLFRKQLKEY